MLNLRDPKRRVQIAGIAVIIVTVVLGGLAIWRYLTAAALTSKALDARRDSAVVTGLSATFWHEREAVNEYLLAPSPAVLAELGRQRAQFSRTAAGVSAGSPGGLRLRDQAVDREKAFFVTFTRVRGAAGTSPVRETTAVAAVDRQGDRELRTLGALNGVLVRRAIAAQNDAAGAKNEVLAFAFAATIGSLIATGVASLTALRALDRTKRREDELLAREDNLMEALGRMSDRNALLDRLRSTAGVLGEATNGLRASATSAVTATSQQSAAIAQTSATIEQLAATAGSIADTVRSVASAAQRTGTTMQDMQGKVEDISARALMLGEGAQKIGDVLALINEIAGRTNMLALNAAIEAARAGEAGKGFAVVAAEVRKLAERSVESTGSISEIIAGIRDQTNATIMATEQGTQQAREVADLMTVTETMLEESIVAAQQQKSAADQVDSAIQNIKQAADQIADGQAERSRLTDRLESLVSELDTALEHLTGQATPGVLTPGGGPAGRAPGGEPDRLASGGGPAGRAASDGGATRGDGGSAQPQAAGMPGPAGSRR